MYRDMIRMSQRMAFLCLLSLFAIPAWAQRTGDHIVPSIETVCDGDPFSFGLCNSYCEALDCDSDTPLGTPTACSNLLDNYLKKSDGIPPPCEATCPCAFDVEADFATLVITGDAEFSPPPIDVAGTYSEICGAHGPNGENAFVAQAAQPTDGGTVTPQAIRLFYWIEAEPATCNEVGGGIDGFVGTLSPDGLDYGPWVERRLSLSPDEVTNCLAKLQQVCP